MKYLIAVILTTTAIYAAEINKPERTTYWVITDGLGTVLHYGETTPDQVTTTGQPSMVVTESEIEHIGNLAPHAAHIPDLPAMGEALQAHEVYKTGGVLYMVRQSHTRTEHNPDDVPALFLKYRADAENADWIEQEQVNVGNRRTYSGSTYQTIQAHQTQTGWEPPNVPALWSLVVAPSVDWQAGASYAVGAEVVYNSASYVCLQAHTAIIGWEPPNVPALWTLIP